MKLIMTKGQNEKDIIIKRWDSKPRFTRSNENSDLTSILDEDVD